MDKIKNDLQGTSKEIEKIGSPIKLRKIESKKNSVIQNVTFIRPQINNVTIISNSIERDAKQTYFSIDFNFLTASIDHKHNFINRNVFSRHHITSRNKGCPKCLEIEFKRKG